MIFTKGSKIDQLLVLHFRNIYTLKKYESGGHRQFSWIIQMATVDFCPKLVQFQYKLQLICYCASVAIMQHIFFHAYQSVITNAYYQYDICTVLFYQLDVSILSNSRNQFYLSYASCQCCNIATAHLKCPIQGSYKAITSSFFHVTRANDCL